MGFCYFWEKFSQQNVICSFLYPTKTVILSLYNPAVLRTLCNKELCVTRIGYGNIYIREKQLRRWFRISTRHVLNEMKSLAGKLSNIKSHDRKVSYDEVLLFCKWIWLDICFIGHTFKREATPRERDGIELFSSNITRMVL